MSYAIVEDGAIKVDAHFPIASKEPDHLSFCKDLRPKCRQIYYVKNKFDMMVHDFDATALLPWIQKANMIRNESAINDGVSQQVSDVPAKSIVSSPIAGIEDLEAAERWQQRVKYAEEYATTLNSYQPYQTKEYGWDFPFEPHWDNFVKWLRTNHSGHINGTECEIDDEPGMVAACAVFTMMDELKDQPWSVVEVVLRGIRKVLGATEPRWLDKAKVEVFEIEEGVSEDDEQEDSQLTEDEGRPTPAWAIRRGDVVIKSSQMDEQDDSQVTGGEGSCTLRCETMDDEVMSTASDDEEQARLRQQKVGEDDDDELVFGTAHQRPDWSDTDED